MSPMSEFVWICMITNETGFQIKSVVSTEQKAHQWAAGNPSRAYYVWRVE